jgi:hypothetical protein
MLRRSASRGKKDEERKKARHVDESVAKRLASEAGP